MLRLPTLSQGLLLDGKALLRAISMGAAGFLMMQSAACSANMATAKGGVEFLCSVQGSDVLSPKQTSASVCRIFKDKIDGVLRRPVTIVRSFSNSNGHNQIKLDIRLSKRGSAVALLEQRNGGKIRKHPEIAIDVMDKSLGKQELEQLAIEVAKQITESNHG